MLNLLELIRAGGIIMIPLLLLSLGAVAVIVERIFAFKSLGATSPKLLPQVLEMARQNRCDEAEKLCDAVTGPLAACLGAILRQRDRPVAIAERKVEEIGQSYFVRLEKLLPFLDTATTISPLLGLLGTIVGMIGTFNAIGAQTRGGGSSDAVLAGVGEALYATAAGITIAVVCFVAYNGFASRLRSITAEVENASTQLINTLIDARAGYFPAEETVLETTNALQKTA